MAAPRSIIDNEPKQATCVVFVAHGPSASPVWSWSRPLRDREGNEPATLARVRSRAFLRQRFTRFRPVSTCSLSSVPLQKRCVSTPPAIDL